MRRLSAALPLPLLLILATCSDETAVPPKAPLTVRAETVRVLPYTPEVSLTGTIAARIESAVSFRIPGRIAERFVEVGQHVEKGTLLARLETAEQEADLAAAQAMLASSEATLRQAEANFGRQERLFGNGYTTGSSFDAAREALRRAEGARDAARASVGTAEEQLRFTELRAEAPGIVTARFAEDGQVVSAAESVFRLAEDGPRDAVFDVFERATTKPPENGRVDVALVGDADVKAVGVVREVAPAFDAASGTVRVKVGIDPAPPGMTLGAAVTGIARFGSDPVVDLPSSAFFTTQGQPSVWVVSAEDRSVSQRPVAVARYLTGRVLVSEGLSEGEIVVTGGNQFLSPGQVVEARMDEAAR